MVPSLTCARELGSAFGVLTEVHSCGESSIVPLSCCAEQVARNPLVVAGRALRVSRAHGHMPDWKVGPCSRACVHNCCRFPSGLMQNRFAVRLAVYVTKPS